MSGSLEQCGPKSAFLYFVSRQDAEAARGSLVMLWRARAKGKGQKRIPPAPTSCHRDADALIEDRSHGPITKGLGPRNNPRTHFWDRPQSNPRTDIVANSRADSNPGRALGTPLQAQSRDQSGSGLGTITQGPVSGQDSGQALLQIVLRADPGT